VGAPSFVTHESGQMARLLRVVLKKKTEIQKKQERYMMIIPWGRTCIFLGCAGNACGGGIQDSRGGDVRICGETCF
jgi:hypothetical protein